MGSIPYHRPEELLARTGWMRALATRLLADPAAADDVVQEAWIATLEHPPREGNEAWLARLVRNFAWKRRRGERRRSDHERAAAAAVAEPVPGPAATAERLELQRTVLAAVEAIDEPFRTAVVERYFQGRTSADIARALGVPEGTVRWRLKRGLEELRTRLDARFGTREAWSALLAPLALAPNPAPASPPAEPGSPAALPLEPGILAMIGASKIVLGAVVGVAAVGFLLWRSEGGVRGARPTAELNPPATLVDPAPAAGLETPPSLRPEPQEARAAAPVIRAQVPAAEPAGAPAARPEHAKLLMRFVDAQGAPYPGVAVAPRWAEKETRTSGLDGRVEFELSSDGGGPKHGFGDDSEWNVALFARRAGCATRLLRATVSLGRTSDLGDVLLEPGVRLEGRVLDEQGLAIEGAEAGLAPAELFDHSEEQQGHEWDEACVRRQGTESFDRTHTTKSDANGAFALDGVASGTFRLWAHAPGMRYGWTEPFEVEAGEDLFALEVRLPALLPTDRITGIVLDPAGKPLPRARLLSTYEIEHESSSTTQDLDEDGRFDLVLRRDALYSFVASDPEHRYADAIAFEVPAGTRELELRLGEKRTFEVAVTDPEGKAVEGCRFVRSVKVGGGTASDQDEPKVLQPGLYLLALPVLTFALEVEAEGFLPRRFEALRPEAVGQRFELVLSPASRLTGRVVAGGKPVPGARVSLHLANVERGYWRNGFPCLYDHSAMTEGTTDSSGAFELTSQGTEPVWLRATAAGWTAADLGPLDPADARELRLELTAGGTIEGRVLLPDGADAEGVVIGIHRGDGHGRTLRAGPEGRFRFDHLSPGRWQVLQRDEELDPSSTTIMTIDEPTEIEWSCTVEAGQVTRYDLDLTRK